MNWVFITALFLSFSVFGSEMSYLQCQNEGEQDYLLLTRTGKTWGGYIKREGSGYVAADSCFSLKDAPEELLASIAIKKDITALCVFITGDDGSGDAIIVRNGKKPSVEQLFVDINDPTPQKSKNLKCH